MPFSLSSGLRWRVIEVPRARPLALLDRVGAVAGGLPARGGGLAGPAGDQLHAIGGHERGVEADAELADQLGDRLLRFALLQAVDELAGAGLGDRADVGDHLVAAHADAVVVDGEGARFWRSASRRISSFSSPSSSSGLVERLETEAVEGVGRVGDQLAEKDLLVRVQRVDHQVEKLLRLGLKLQGLNIFRGSRHSLLLYAPEHP